MKNKTLKKEIKIMNEQFDNVTFEVEEVVATPVKKNWVKGVLVTLGITALAGGIVLAVKKNKAKIRERNIKNLEKDGYVVIRPNDESTNEFDELIESVK